MATTAVLEGVHEQIKKLETDSSSLKSKLSAAEAQLQNNQAEQVDVSEGIARGTRKHGEAASLLRKSEEILASVAGLRGLIGKNQAQLDGLIPEMRRIDSENLLAKRRAELESLRRNGAEIVEGINAKLRALIQSDLPALDAVRDAMMQYQSLGGQAAGAALCEMLITNNGTLLEEDALTNQRRDLHTSPPAWMMRGDLVLTVRNLWPARNR
jgi:chromosome segregation ATPase